MGYQPRLLEKFEDLNALTSYSFSMADFEQDTEQQFIIPHQATVGMNYGYLFRSSPPIKQPFPVRFRASILESSPADVDTEIDAMLGTLYNAGLGYLYSIDSAGTRRRVLAIFQRYNISWRAGDIFRKGIGIEFLCFDDWRAVTATTGTATITASGQTFTITNPGSVINKLLVIRLRANTSAGIINPKLTNQANGYTLESARDSASVNSEIMFTLAYNERKVEYSNDNGATYADDFAQLVLPTTHPPLHFDTNLGDNTIQYTGGASQSLDIEWSFYAPYLTA